MKVNIRKAKFKEIKLIQDLNAELFKSDGPRDKFLNHNWPYREGEKYFKKVISGNFGKAVCFVAEVDGKLIGYLAGAKIMDESWRTVKNRIELENMFVKNQFRGKGIGTKLIKEFFKWGSGKKAGRVLVLAYASNYKAIEFYKKNKFSPFSLSLEAEL